MRLRWSFCILASLLAGTSHCFPTWNDVRPEQKPLRASSSSSSWQPSFTITEQDPELCDAGSRYFTGSVNITSDKSMFFWYFESRSNPETDPVLLWMSGGPGATGEFGLFKDIGPCTVNDDGNSTSRQPYSWTDHANVIFIDQPIGIGFSTITDRNTMATNLAAGARDLHAFLSVLTTAVLPSLASRPWHITGESMGGHYVVGYTQYLIQQQRAGRGPSLDICSGIIVDGLIDVTRYSVGYYDFFCADWRSDGRVAPIFNDTACEVMASAVPACERRGEACRDEYDSKICFEAARFCEMTVGAPYIADIRPGGWDPYDSRHKCTEPPLCSDLDSGPALDYLNEPWVQQRLGFPDFDFKLVDFDANRRWVEDGDLFRPVTRELTWLLDNTEVHILFINGNNDIIINTPAQIRTLDEQPWSRQAWFRAQRYQDWRFKDGKLLSVDDAAAGRLGGTWKGDDRLSLFTVDDAGHASPWAQPEAVGALVRSWLAR